MQHFPAFFYPKEQKNELAEIESESTLETEGSLSEEETISKPRVCCSARLLVTIICFFAIFNMSFLRIGVSMAMVCLAHTDVKNTWSPATKGYIISASFYGFIVGPILAGFISFRLGGKITLVIGSFVSGLLHFFLPQGIPIVPLFLSLRIAVGFFAGFTFPSIYDVFAHWVVPEERQLLVTGALVSIPSASILNFPLSGLICEHLGWIWLFYLFGIWLVIFSGICIFLLFNYPEECPYISEEERNFIESRTPRHVRPKIPWKDITRSMPIYAFAVIHFCVHYVYLTLIFSLPLIMRELYNFSLRQNGLYSSFPFMGSLIVRILMSLFFEHLRRKLKTSKNKLRKFFVFSGSTMTAFFLMLACLMELEQAYWVLVCFILAATSLEFCLTGGYLLSLLDLCPMYANVLTGFINAIGNAAGLICPVVNGFITRHGTAEEWNAVLYVNIGILLMAMVFYLVFGKNEIQPWAVVTTVQQMPLTRPSLVN